MKFNRRDCIAECDVALANYLDTYGWPANLLIRCPISLLPGHPDYSHFVDFKPEHFKYASYR